MLRTFFNIVLVAALLGTMAMVERAAGEIRMAGTVGIDFTAHSFTSVHKEQNSKYGVNRSMSDHYLRMSATGVLVNKEFAAYSLAAKLLGTFSQSSNRGASSNHYFSPSLASYSGSLTFFPGRRVTLNLFRAADDFRSLTYRQSERTKFESSRPELGVVLQQIQGSSQNGANLSARLTDWMTVVASGAVQSATSGSEYDFDEERDIWVELIDLLPDPNSDVHNLEVINLLADASVRLVIDGLDTTLAPKEIAQLVVDSGEVDVLIVPSTYYHQYEFSIRPGGDMVWKIQRGSIMAADARTDRAIVTTEVGLGRDEARSWKARLEHDTKEDPATARVVTRDVLSTSGKYAFNDNDQIKLETELADSETVSGLGESRGNGTARIRTQLSHSPALGINANVDYEFIRSTSSQAGKTQQSEEHVVRARVARKFYRQGYDVELKGDLSKRDDGTGTLVDRYTLGLRNAFDRRMLGVNYRPSLNTEYSLQSSSVINGDGTSTGRWQIRMNLELRPIRRTFLGEVQTKGSYNFFQIDDKLTTRVQRTYEFEAGLDRSLTSRLAISGIYYKKWEVADAAAVKSSVGQSDIEEIVTTSLYRVDAEYAVTTGLLLGVGYSVSADRIGDVITKSLIVGGIMPYLNMPITLSVNHATQVIPNLPVQVAFNLSYKLKHSFRRISIELEHAYSKDEQVLQDFSYHEIVASIKRSIGF